MYNEEITLVDIVNAISNGNVSETEKKKTLNARIESVTRNEFYAARSAGFNPEIKFVIPDFRDYDRQRYIDYEGRRYVVTRTFRAVDSTALEFVCEGVTEDGAV